MIASKAVSAITPNEMPRRSGRHRESLADVLRRRSAAEPEHDQNRASAVAISLQAVTREASGVLTDVPLQALLPNPYQPRYHFHRQPLQELAQSLADEGQLEPVIARRVWRDGVEVLEIVAGARRLEAAKLCDASIRPFPTLRTDIRELTDEEAERLSLIENLQRENLTPLEEGYCYWQLQQRDPGKWSVRAIAEFVHKKKSTVQNRLGLVREPEVAAAVLREEIPPTAGFHIMRLPAPERPGYLRSAVRAGLTVEQIKADVDRRLAPRRAPVIVRLDQARKGEVAPGDATDDEGGAGEAGRQEEGEGALVRAHRRRSRRAPAMPASALDGMPAAERVRHLNAERETVQEHITALETELRQQLARLRALDHELALLKA